MGDKNVKDVTDSIIPLRFESYLSIIKPTGVGVKAWLAWWGLIALIGCSPDQVSLEVVLDDLEPTTYASSSLDFKVSAVGGKPERYELLKDGTSVASFKGGFYRWESAAIAEGRYELRVRAFYRSRTFDSPSYTVILDHTAPTLSSVPANGASGLRSDTQMTVSFSEPMNPTSVQGAYKSDTLPAGSVDLRWNNEATLLTITPKQPLEYALETAKTYDFTLSSAAKDRAGNSIASTRVGFKTLRRKTRSFEPENPPTRYLSGNADMIVGTLASNIAQVQYLSFELSDLGSTPAGDIQSASLKTLQSGCVGEPFTQLGGVKLESVWFSGQSVPDPTSVSVLRDLGILSSQPSPQTHRLEVLEALRADWSQRGERDNRSKYRLRFEGDSAPLNHNCTFKANRSSLDTLLEVVYLTP